MNRLGTTYNRRLWAALAFAVALVATGSAHAATTFLATHETHPGHTWAAPSWNQHLTVTGTSTEHVAAGTGALELLFDAADWGMIETTTFTLQSAQNLHAGFTLRVWTEPVGTATGAPALKLETGGAGQGDETPLNLNAWTTVRLPAANLSGAYGSFKIVLGTGGATGQFKLWVDSLRREGQIWDGFDTPYVPSHTWTTPTWNTNLQVIGYSNEHTQTGRAALKLRLDASNWGLVETPAFTAENANNLTQGFSARVYVEPVGSVSGVPSLKLETAGAGQGSEIPLTLNAWTTVILPAANLSGSYTAFKLVAGQNGSSGFFNIYVDSLLKDGLLWDDFEAPAQVNFALGSTGGTQYHYDANLLGGVMGDPVYGDIPRATQGHQLFGLRWDGEDNGSVEFKWQFPSDTYSLEDQDAVLIDVFYPDGLAVPTGNLFYFVDSWTQVWPNNHFANGKWLTLEGNIASNTSAGQYEMILVMNNLPTSGTLFVDNLRLAAAPIHGLSATGHDRRIDLTWDDDPDAEFEYNIYRSDSATGTYTLVNAAPASVNHYSDFTGANGQTYFYKVRPVAQGTEAGNLSGYVQATTVQMTQAELLDSVQRATFRYAWDFGHPACGLTRERFAAYDRNTVTTGGTGFGLMSIIAGADRGYITRAQAAERINMILTYMDEVAAHYHGAFSHWNEGTTGEPLPFGDFIGADIHETALFMEGVVAALQYFDSASDPVEIELRGRASSIYNEVEWDWYLKEEGSMFLYWLWSPTEGWGDTFQVHGHNECLITYLLAIAAPAHAIPPACYEQGYCSGDYFNGAYYYGLKQWVGQPVGGGPLFFTHYSYLGLDPRDKRDRYCNYFELNKNCALIHQAYCADNPLGYTGYSSQVWGLTSSMTPPPQYYLEHQPAADKDNGTLTPCAALASMPYTPAESLQAMVTMYETYGDRIWGPFGFYDAFNPTLDWWPQDYLAIDQVTIPVMIENYRSGKIWDLFMSYPAINPALEAMGWTLGKRVADSPEATLTGLDYEYYEGTWTSLPDFDALTPTTQSLSTNFDLSVAQREDNFALRWTGYIQIAQAGSYDFYLDSDDGSQLYIGDRLVVDHDGLHGTGDEQQGGIDLEAGLHAITVVYLESTGEQALTVRIEGRTMAKQAVPASLLYRDDPQGHTPVTLSHFMIYDY